MFNEHREKEIRKYGNSLVVTLTRELKKLGVGEGNYIHVGVDTNTQSIILKNNSDVIVPLVGDENAWSEFYRICSEKERDPNEMVSELIEDFIKKNSSLFWNRPLFRIK